MPLVSVVVPTYNSSRTLEACLQSVKAQVFQDIELIVVDNSSTDTSSQIAARYADRVERWGPERSAQRNRGSALASGKYLIFIDSDMVLEPTVISDCVAAAAAGADAVIVPEATLSDNFWSRCRALERNCYNGDDLIEAARFCATSTFLSVGGFDEELYAGEDWDLSQRLALGGHLPRVASSIIHDERGFRLWSHLGKKVYYGRSLRKYLKKNSAKGAWQSNILFRRAYFSNWRRLANQPSLACGIFALKALEGIAYLLGATGMFERSHPNLVDA